MGWTKEQDTVVTGDWTCWELKCFDERKEDGDGWVYYFQPPLVASVWASGSGKKNLWCKNLWAVAVLRGNSITIPSALPHFPIRSNTSGHMPTSLMWRLLLSQPAVHAFKSCCQMIYCILRYLWCANASLRSNQWFLLRITPTQTVASYAIIILLRSFASQEMETTCVRGGR